jgi:D-proline reductase (dithiol) PrdB
MRTGYRKKRHDVLPRRPDLVDAMWLSFSLWMLVSEAMPQPPDAVAYMDRTRRLYARQSPYRWVEHDPEQEPPPWIPIERELAATRVALIASGGVHLDDQEPFHFRKDTSHREIPFDTLASRLRVSHFGYDVGDATRDPDCVLPLRSLRDLAKEGVTGAIAGPALSFMGGIYSARRVREELAPRLRDIVLRQKADLAYLVPA